MSRSSKYFLTIGVIVAIGTFWLLDDRSQTPVPAATKPETFENSFEKDERDIVKYSAEIKGFIERARHSSHRQNLVEFMDSVDKTHATLHGACEQSHNFSSEYCFSHRLVAGSVWQVSLTLDCVDDQSGCYLTRDTEGFLRRLDEVLPQSRRELQSYVSDATAIHQFGALPSDTERFLDSAVALKERAVSELQADDAAAAYIDVESSDVLHGLVMSRLFKYETTTFNKTRPR